MLEEIRETTEWLNIRKGSCLPKVAIILGSGLGNLRKEIAIETEIPYSQIPHFPVPTVEGHAGTLIFGKIGQTDIVAMNGRFHYYEGYSTKETTLPVRVFHTLGIRYLFASNAAGGTNPEFKVGDLMIITDHINLLPEHPLRGRNMPPGPRFLEMSNAYSADFITKALAIGQANGFALRTGIYLATQGPTYETPAEYRMFRLLGADAVGMSTVPEIIVARHCGMTCFGVSVITNSGQKNAAVSHEEVKEAADAAQPRMTLLFKELLKQIEE